MASCLLITITYYLVSLSHAIAPPHPDFQEAYLKDRRRLLKHAPSSTKQQQQQPRRRLLDPQFCKDLSDKECSDWNESFEGHTRKLNGIVKRTGTLRPLVLLMKFSDHTERPLPTRDQVDELWNGIGINDNIPTGSIFEFIDTNSLGELFLEADVMDWQTTDNTEEYYADGQSGLTRSLALSMHPLLKQLDSDGLDFSQYDSNNDGIIDVIVILTSSFPAEIGGSECYQNRNYMNRIWSHTTSSFFQNFETSQGLQIGAYVFGSALRGNCGGQLARLGVITHEFIHTWGIPDLYDTKGDFVGKGVGSFDIMGNPYGLNGQQDYPNHLGPWTKIKSGWVNPTEITADGLYKINAAEISNQVYKISNFPNPDEYLLIENRQPIYWDKFLFNGGLLIWHIDEAADLNNNRGYPGQNGWPGNGYHYSVALEQADRNYDLENGWNIGDQYDFWVNGTEYKYGPVEKEASDFDAYPNSNAYRLGVIQTTNVKIYDISPSGNIMTFRVSGVSPPTAEPTKSPAAPPDPPSFSPSATPSGQPVPTPRPSRRPTRTPKTIPTSEPIPTTSPSVVPEPGVSFEPSKLRTKSPSRGLTGYDISFSYFTNSPTTRLPPVTFAPAEDAPVTFAPVEDAPVTFAPAEDAPVTVAPVEDAPVTVAPAEDAPVTVAPVDVAPVTVAPAVNIFASPLDSSTTLSPATSPSPNNSGTKPIPTIPTTSLMPPNSMEATGTVTTSAPPAPSGAKTRSALSLGLAIAVIFYWLV
jgi:M6 family metalloprotease-like protein